MDNLVRWAGGKRNLVDVYKAYNLFKKDSFLIEPFLGGGASFLGFKNKYAIGADTNLSLIYLWQMVRDDWESLVSWYSYYHDLHSTQGSEAYYSAREVYNSLLRNLDTSKWVSNEKKIDIAGVFLYIMNTCHNGLCRYSKKEKKYNVPIGDRLPEVEAIKEKLMIISSRIQGCRFHAWDFERTINFYTKGTVHYPNVFIYCDPPYSRSEGGKEFQDYTGNWQASDADRLAQLLLNCGRDFAVSEADTPEVRERYKDCYKIEINASRSIGGDRKKAKELLILSRL